jgi:GNAT superfamily N-acetyltransferase
MHIRDRVPEDARVLGEMARWTHELDGYPKYLPDDPGAFIASSDAFAAWVAEVDGQVAGHVALHDRTTGVVMELASKETGLDSSDLVVLARLIVSPGRRGLGLGRLLLEKATGESVRLGRRAVLDVVDSHTAAIRLYERNGWTCLGDVEWALPDGRGFHEYVYLSPDPVGP